jgi:hypothetical protein
MSDCRNGLPRARERSDAGACRGQRSRRAKFFKNLDKIVGREIAIAVVGAHRHQFGATARGTPVNAPKDAASRGG